jgi:multiple sugar transport system substrate-binding protein
MKIRTFAAALSLLVVGAVLAGCSQPAASGPTVTSLNLWMPTFAADETSDQNFWDEQMKGFTEETGVKVNTTIVPWANFAEKYLTGTAGTDGPDIAYIYTTIMLQLQARNQLEPFDDYLTAEDKAKYTFLDSVGKVDGKYYQLPILVGAARVMYVNNDILKAAGVTETPTTWEEFEAASKKILDAGYIPFEQAWGDNLGAMAQVFYPYLYQAGGDLFSEDGTKTAFNSPAGLKAAKFLVGLKDKGILTDSTTSQTTAQNTDDFLAGKVAFFVSADSSYQQFSTAGFDLGVTYSLKDKQEGTFVADGSLIMLKSCKDKQLCTDLANYVLSGPVMTAFHKQLAMFPPIATDETSAIPAVFDELYNEHADILHSFPVVNGSDPVTESLWKNLQQMMLGDKTPEQALQDAADEGDAALADAQK